MPEPHEMTIYGRVTCEDTTRSLTFLNTLKIPFVWQDTERDPDARRKAEQLNNGKLRTPTIVFGDGTVLVEPSDAALATKLNLRR